MIHLRFHFGILLMLLFSGAVAGARGGKEGAMAANPAPGFYPGSVTVSLPQNVRYTLTGATPTATATAYTEPFAISETTVVRYACFDDAGKRTSHIHGASYLIGEPPTKLLTLSVGIDGWRLFDQQRGWFKPGHGADPGSWKKPGANWWTKREHPCHLDLIESDGKPLFSGTVGYRMFGGMSRLHPQKSFSLSARKRYGHKRIKHPLFGEEAGKSFRFLVARNGGSDWNRSYIRDALLTDLLQDDSWDLERQAARPVQVYLNGRYWGIYHLREKINPQYLEDRHPTVDKNALDLLEHRESVKHGRLGEYRKLQRLMERGGLADPAVYRRVEALMDIDNFMRLQIAQLYFDNRDAGGNIRFWRPHGDGHRWRWIMYDVDQGFGLHRDSAFVRNTLEFMTEANGPQWPNPPWSTLFHRRLLENPGYRRAFVNRTLDYLHTDFAPEVVAATTERHVTRLTYDMPRQLERWRGKTKNWRLHLDRLRRFGRHRPAHLREHLREYFTAGEDRDVSLTATAGGYIVINDNIRVDEASYRARYFSRLPLHLRAVAHPGFHFVGWEGIEVDDPAFDMYLSHDREYTVKAIFEPYRHPLADRIVFNEVHPNGKAGGDWLELFNRTEVLIDLSGWRLTDAHQEFRLPDVRLEAGDYLVVCRDLDRFRATHPTAHNVIGGLPFGLDKDGDRLGLYGPAGGYVNAFAYGPHPDTAFVHALTLPGLDNQDPRHWAVVPGAGTPCAANPEYLEGTVVTRQGYWLRIGIGLGVLLLIGVFKTSW